MAELSPQTKRLIQRYQDWHRNLQPKTGVSTIHVDEVASKIAAFYEKIRGVIDWHEEHLLRRAAIERILKRRLFWGQQEGKELTAPFVFELIRGGYFSNDKIEETKLETIQKLIDKYVFILKNSPPPPAEKMKIHLYGWLLSIAACEVEEILDPLRRERALIDYMEELMKERIVTPAGMTPQEKDIQISIAVQKSLFKLDKSIISYHLLKMQYPEWLALPDIKLQEAAKNIYSIWENIVKALSHPLGAKFYQICERYDTPYLILGDIISNDPMTARERIENAAALENTIKEEYSKRLNKSKSRISRMAIYSTISIFITKILLAIFIEVPFDKYITGEFSLQTLGINIVAPPLLMFFLILTIRPPGKGNLNRVLLETMKITFESEKKDSYYVKVTRKRGFILNAIITLFYLVTFVVSFGFIWWGLGLLDFGILSRIIFVIFLSLISFAGTKIRESAKELLVEEEKGGFWGFVLDSFSLPFIRMGKWLSGQWARYNVIVVVINALIDLPFQLFTEFLEQWRYFLKEKKGEIH